MTPVPIPHERLRRLQELANQAGNTLQPASCLHSSGSTQLIRIMSTGMRVVYEGCVDCHEQIRGTKATPFRSAKDDLPIGRDDRYLTRHCERCGALGTEIHHWSPRGIFGRQEAERWPTSYLCPGCHAWWHEMMRTADSQLDIGS